MGGEDPNDDGSLVRGLGLWTATSVSLGAVIGSGIFIGANRVAAGTPNAWAMLAVWVGAGLASLLGALVYAEFGAAMPRSGSDYVYVRRSISPYWGFLSGWATLAINVPASIAAVALAFASQLDSLKPDSHAFLLAEGFSLRFTAVGLIALFTLLNVLGVRRGGSTQGFLTALKLGLIAVLIAIGVSTVGNGGTPTALFSGDRPTVAGGFAVALVGALWATDGWNGVTRVAGEVRAPQRNLPRALIMSAIIVTTVYVLLNVAYLAALGLDGMAGEGSDARLIASRAAEAAVGPWGATFVSILIMVSILGGLNGMTLSGPRVYYAMASDGLFFRSIKKVHPRWRTPYVSILFQGGFAAFLAIAFSFEQLTSYVVLAAWVSYALAAWGLLVLRRREPDLDRPYRVPLYPFVPVAFALLASAFVVYLIVDAVALAFIGQPTTLAFLSLNLVALSMSVPLYLWFRGRGAGSDA